jgi:4-amino-4-deoxy-L-arabinose transferase-like glycosyltransferase
LPIGLWSAGSEIRHDAANRRSAAFVLCWVGCYFAFFTAAATKLPNYVVPCYPALAIVTGAWLSAAIARATARDWRLVAGYASLAIVGATTAVGLGIAAQKIVHQSPTLALPAVVALVGGLICVLLLHGGRHRASLTNVLATCLLMTFIGMTYTASHISPLADGPKLAAKINALAATEQHTPRVATYHYSPPTLVYYLHHPVERLESADLAGYFSHGDVIVMPRDAFEQQRDQLPANIRILSEVPRFLRKDKSVVLLGRTTDVAQRETGDTQAR